MGIGTLSEKSIHSLLKEYLEPDKQYHEVKVGNYIADIKKDNEIFEIQTQQFKKLLSKLDYYTENNYSVTVVYPLVHQKYINWLSPLSNDIIERRKSSYKGYIQDIFKELYWIKEYIANNEIKLKIISLEVEEYKYLDGYGQNSKKHATKIDKVPTKVIDVININSVNDMKIFLPDTLPENFTSKDFQKCTRSRSKYLGSGLKILRELGIITIVGKKGNSYIYKVTSN
jgi:hypothetical protein